MSQSHHYAQQEQRIQPINISTSDYVYQLHRPPPADPPPLAREEHHSNSDDYHIEGQLETSLAHGLHFDEEEQMRRLDARREAAERVLNGPPAHPSSYYSSSRSERCCKECCGRRERSCWCMTLICLVLCVGIVAGFIIAGQQGDLEQQCPLEWSRVNVMGEDSSFASKLPPSKWLYVFSGTSIGEVVLLCFFLNAAEKARSGFEGLPMIVCCGIPLILMLVFKFAWATTGLVLVSQSKFCSDTNDTAKYMIMIAAVWTYVQLFLGCPIFMVLAD